MSFQIRPYISQDAASILEIINDSILNTSFNYDYYPKSLEELQITFNQKIKEGIPVLVAENQNEILGYATFGKFRAKPGYDQTVEHTIYLKRSAQGKGLGSAMLLQLIELAKTMGHHVMIAGMDSENRQSYLFHQKLGFKEVGRIPEVAYKFEKRLTLVLMQRILTESR